MYYTCVCICVYANTYVYYIYIYVFGGGCIYVYCSSPYLYIVNMKFLMGFLLSLKIRKNKHKGGGGGLDIEFPGVLKKAYGKCGNSKDQLKKKWDFQGCSRKNHPWNIHGFYFLTLEFPGGVTQFFRISIGESLFFKGKVTNLKIVRIFSEKFILNPPPFGFLLEWPKL